MSKVYGVDSPAKVDGVATPAKVDGVTFSYAPAGYWPVAGVTEPQHLWPFFQTGDYTDQGSTGGVTLTADGTGNSFTSDGLVVDGNGWADGGWGNADLDALGTSYSILCHVYWPYAAPTSTHMLIEVANSYTLNFQNPGITRFVDKIGAGTTSGTLAAGWYQIIGTVGGGTLTLYINGAYVNSVGAGPGDNTHQFMVGARFVSSYLCENGTIFKMVGILKGEAWSSGDVADIYTALG